MLKKKYRLNSRIKPEASVVQTKFFTLKFSRNGLSQSRFGFIVSKRVDKRAVVRNKIKRKIRTCIEDAIYKIQSGYDMLFIIKQSALEEKKICPLIEEILNSRGLLT